jgi:hypothetical protein
MKATFQSDHQRTFRNACMLGPALLVIVGLIALLIETAISIPLTCGTGTSDRGGAKPLSAI